MPDDSGYERRLRAITLGEPAGGPIELADPDPRWSERFRAAERRIRAALGRRALRVEHVGSTAVPDLPAKPIVDVVLEVPDAADEAAYRPPLEAAGYALLIREPEWHQHRLFADAERTLNLHVFTAGCPETERMVALRDRLRRSPADRRRYAAEKRRLASLPWRFVQQYADAKSGVVAEILAAVETAGGRVAPQATQRERSVTMEGDPLKTQGDPLEDALEEAEDGGGDRPQGERDGQRDYDEQPGMGEDEHGEQPSRHDS